MRNFFKIIFLCVITIIISSCGGSEKKGLEKVNQSTVQAEGVDILPGLNTEVVKNDLENFPRVSLNYMLKRIENRTEYIRGLFASNKIQEVVKERKLNENKKLLLKISAAKNQVYKDALVSEYFDERKKDLEVLAKDRYEAEKESYSTRRKIKIAQIYLSKINRNLEETKKILDIVSSKLKNDEDFFTLADEYSEDKDRALKGGVYPKWLIEPKNGGKTNKILTAAFNLKTVREVSEVVESTHGFHIIKLMQDSPRQQRSFEAVKDGIISKMRSELVAAAEEKVKKMIYPAPDVKHNDDVLRKLIEEANKATDDN